MISHKHRKFLRITFSKIFFDQLASFLNTKSPLLFYKSVRAANIRRKFLLVGGYISSVRGKQEGASVRPVTCAGVDALAPVSPSRLREPLSQQSRRSSAVVSV